jgi:putative tricarboxylic transport membrane protein
VDQLISGLGTLFEPVNFLLLVAGSLVGVVFGMIPGLQNVTALSVLLPFTFGMAPTHAFILMVAIYNAGVFGGSITAILYNIPGAPENAATTFDGHPLALQGRAAEALGTAIACSALGGLISTAVLIFAAPQIAPLALKFGPPEYFGLIFFTLCLIALMGGAVLKSAISAMLGLFFATVGLSSITGQPRFTFGFEQLYGGFDFVVLVVGVFAVAEVFARAEREARGKVAVTPAAASVKARLPRLSDFWEMKGTIGRSSVLGTFVGILPALGAAAAAFMAYAMERRLSRTPEQFGKGVLKGVAAPETANNASVGGALIPLLTLGIPGSSSTAVMLGAFLVYGLQPGEALFRNQGSLVSLIYATMLMTNALILILGVVSIPWCARFMRTPFAYMAPVIILLCAIGAYTVRSNIVDVWSMFAFGVLGYVLNRYGFSVPVFVMAFILGDIGETAFLRSMALFDNDVTQFFAQPISGTLLALSGATIVWSIGAGIYRVLSRRRRSTDRAGRTASQQP